MIEPLAASITPDEAEAVAYTNGDETTVNYTYDELSAYTKAELLEIAEQNGVEGLSMTNTKDEMINTILGAE